MINEVTVRSLDELNKALFENEIEMGASIYKYAYRGMSCCDYSLKSSLFRMGENIYSNENSILSDFTKYSKIFSKEESDNLWNQMAKAQHHGLPTRLLDWTYSPYVAMHFATDNTSLYHKDAVIWVLDIEKINTLLPSEFFELLDEGNCFTTNQLKLISNSLIDFKKKYEAKEFLLFFEPPSIDQRIINQFGLFSLVANPSMTIEKTLINHPEFGKKVIVPFKLKIKIRNILDHSNISERVLFPDLEGMCKWITRKHSSQSYNNEFVSSVKEIDEVFLSKKESNDKTIEIINSALNYGAPIYNQGEYDKCYSIYKYAFTKLVSLNINPSEVEEMSILINNELKATTNSLIWDMRRFMDRLKKNTAINNV